MAGWNAGVESHTLKAGYKDNMSEKVSEEEYDFRTGIKTTHKRERKQTSSQEASIEKYQLGAFKGTEHKTLIHFESEQRGLVPVEGSFTGPCIGYRSDDMNITPLREKTTGGSDEEEEYIDERFRQQNPRLLRKRTRRYEGTKETGREFRDNYKTFGLF